MSAPSPVTSMQTSQREFASAKVQISFHIHKINPHFCLRAQNFLVKRKKIRLFFEKMYFSDALKGGLYYLCRKFR